MGRFEIKNNEDYELWTTTSDNGKTFGRIEVDFKRPVSIYLGDNDVSFHHVKHISSDKIRKNLSYYNEDKIEIVGSIMNIDIDYVTEGGVRHNLGLKDFMFKKSLKDYFEDRFNVSLDLSDYDLVDFCRYFGIETFNSLWDLREEIQDIQRLDGYTMDFIDVESMADDLGFEYIDDALWIDSNDVSIFEEEYDFQEALEEWKNS